MGSEEEILDPQWTVRPCNVLPRGAMEALETRLDEALSTLMQSPVNFRELGRDGLKVPSDLSQPKAL